MKIVLIAAAFVLALSTGALACSGTTDYPAGKQALESNPHLSAEQKAVLMKELMAGMAQHNEAHQTGDMSKMGQSLQTLQTLKPKIGL